MYMLGIDQTRRLDHYWIECHIKYQVKQFQAWKIVVLVLNGLTRKFQRHRISDQISNMNRYERKTNPNTENTVRENHPVFVLRRLHIMVKNIIGTTSNNVISLY